jgi:hypothetical protein
LGFRANDALRLGSSAVAIFKPLSGHCASRKCISSDTQYTVLAGFLACRLANLKITRGRLRRQRGAHVANPTFDLSIPKP